MKFTYCVAECDSQIVYEAKPGDLVIANDGHHFLTDGHFLNGLAMYVSDITYTQLGPCWTGCMHISHLCTPFNACTLRAPAALINPHS